MIAFCLDCTLALAIASCFALATVYTFAAHLFLVFFFLFVGFWPADLNPILAS